MEATFTYLENHEIYEQVIQEGMLKAKSSIWIATADIKDVQIQVGTMFQSVIKTFAALSAKGIDIRILHSGVPTDSVIASLKKYAFKFNKNHFAMKRCPRVHFKAMILDGSKLYVGSANLTGAGLGAKSDHRRNFELGFLTEDKKLTFKVSSFFNVIWSGSQCRDCDRKSVCPVPLEEWKFE